MTSRLLKDIVYNRIRDMIILGQLPMGEKLSETLLADRLNATKAPVRDAIKRLQSEGLVTIKPQSGTFVFTLDIAELTALLEFRYCIEVDALKLAYERNFSVFLQELKAILNRMEHCIEMENNSEYLQQDSQFHQLFFDYSDNTYHQQAYHLISSRMATIRTRLGCNREHMLRSYSQHEEIVMALESRSLEKACQHLIAHIIPRHGAYWKADNLGI